MALTLDTNARIPVTALATTTANPITANYTCGANAEVLVVMICYAGVTQRAGGSPTYNSVAMKQVESLAGVTEVACEMWYLLHPPTGSALAISIPNTNGLTAWVYVASGSAASTHTMYLDDTGITETTAASPTVAVATSANGALIFAVVATGDNGFAPSGRTGTSLYEEDIASYGSGAQYLVKADSGAQNMTWTEGTSDDYGALAAAFLEIIILVPSAAEAVTVADSPTVAVVSPPASDLNVSAAEAVAVLDFIYSYDEYIGVADSAEASLPDALAVVASEAVTVADSPAAVASDPQVSAAEAVTIVDTPAASVETIAGIEVVASETVYVYESPFFGQPILQASATEAVSVADTPTVAISDPQIVVVEALTVADTPQVVVLVEGELNVSASEAVGVTDTAVVAVVAVSDQQVIASEAVTIADTATVAVNDTQVLAAESVNVADTPTVAISDPQIVVAEAVNVSDAPNVDVQIDAISTEAISVADSSSGRVRAAWYNPDAIVVNVGSIVSGTIEDTWSDNGTRLQLAETTGTPGFSYDFYFYDVPSLAQSVEINGYYSGNPAHEVKIYQYNFTTTAWTPLTPDAEDFPSSAGDATYDFSLLGGVNYNSGGEVRLRIVHNSAGNPLHYLYIDEMVMLSQPVIHVNESIGVSDNGIVAVSDPQVVSSESIGVSDTPVVDIQVEVISSEAVGVSDSPVVEIATEIVASESISVVDTSTADVSDPQIVVAEAVGVVDSPQALVQVEGVVYLLAAESVSVSDTPVVDVSDPQIVVSESISVVDTPDVDVSDPQVVVAEAVGVVDSPQVLVQVESVIYLLAAESVSVADAPIVDVSDPQVVATDIVGVTDSVTSSIHIDVSSSESVTIVDQPTADVSDLNVIASESVGVADSPQVVVLVEGVLYVSASESVGVLDSPQVLVSGPQISASESVVVTDSASVVVEAVTDLIISAIENISVTDGPTMGGLLLALVVAESISVTDSTDVILANATDATFKGMWRGMWRGRMRKV